MLKVVGDVCLDCTSHGIVTRMSEEEPSAPIIRTGAILERVGMAGNVALGVKALGVDTHLYTVTGADEAHKRIKYYMENDITTTPVVGGITTIKHRIVVNTKQFARIDTETTYDLSTHLQFIPQKSDKVTIFSDYGKGVLTNIKQFLSYYHKVGVKALIDPKGVDWEKYSNAYVLKPNLAEFKAFVGEDLTPGSTEFNLAAQRVREQFNIAHLIITAGGSGCYLFTGTAMMHFPAAPTKVADVCGAGDSFIAGLAVALYNDKPMNEAIMFAQKVAAFAVSQPGTYVVQQGDING